MKPIRWIKEGNIDTLLEGLWFVTLISGRLAHFVIINEVSLNTAPRFLLKSIRLVLVIPGEQVFLG